MIGRLAAAAAVAAVGCYGDTVVLVREAVVVDGTLVVTKCTVSSRRSGVEADNCFVERQPLPEPTAVRREYPVVPSPLATIEPRDLEVVLATLRDPLANCASANRMTGVMRVRLAIDPSGSVRAVDVETRHAALASCVRDACARVQFPPSAAGAWPVVSFFAPGGEGAARSTPSDCLDRRRKALIAAEQIRDANERARALSAIQECPKP